MIVVNICPACHEPLTDFKCGNDGCKSCDRNVRFRRLVIKSKDGEEGIIACPFCGFEEGISFWSVQEIELFIATQGVVSFTEAGELYEERRKK